MADDLLAAAAEYLPGGSTRMWSLPPDLRFAKRLVDAVPCAEKVRFVSTGTEATMMAIRMARVFTHREKVLKFEGGWHGRHDEPGPEGERRVRVPVSPRLHEIGRRLRTQFADVAARRGVPRPALGDGPIVQPLFVDPKRVIENESDLGDADSERTMPAFDESRAAIG